MPLNSSNIKIGILGLQGAFQKHQQMLEKLSVNSIIIRYPEEIHKSDGIILPGGESSTMTKLLRNMELFEPLMKFSGPMFGTCAGAILLSISCDDRRVEHFAKVPVKTIRNAYGRQIESFVTKVNVSDYDNEFPAVFIRAPQFYEIDDSVEILGQLQGKPVLLKYKNIILSSFHPELTEDTRIHETFLKMLD